MIRTGFLVLDRDKQADQQQLKGDVTAFSVPGNASSTGSATSGSDTSGSKRPPAAEPNGSNSRQASLGRTCPRCGNRGLYRVEGCWTCNDCTYSHCG